MKATHTIGRTLRGDIFLRTLVELNDEGRTLRLETSKTDRGLSATATVVHYRPDGSFTHALGGKDGDYRAVIERTAQRATLANIREMNKRALAHLAEIVATAQAHYAQRELA